MWKIALYIAVPASVLGYFVVDRQTIRNRLFEKDYTNTIEDASGNKTVSKAPPAYAEAVSEVNKETAVHNKQ